MCSTLYLPEVAEASQPAVPDGTAQDILPDKRVPPELVSAARSLPQPHSTGDEAPSRFHGEKILIVDDDRRNVFALSSMFEAHGLQVVFADNGVAGVRALERNEDIALVLMDVMMPELDGNATIAVTAKAMKEYRPKSLASGANDYVTKPVDTDLLLKLIYSHLHNPSDAHQHAQTITAR